MNRETLQTLLDNLREADKRTNEAHAMLCAIRTAITVREDGAFGELDADLAYRKSLSAYVAAKIAYDNAANEFLKSGAA